MKVAEIMSRDVVSVRPDASLKHVAQLLVEHGISGLPVTDSEGNVLGVISEADVIAKERGAPERTRGPLAWLFAYAESENRRKFEACAAHEAMSSPTATIEADRSLPVAASMMLDHGVNRLPVTRGGRLVGIVTRHDLVRAFARKDAEVAQEILEDVVTRTMLLDPTTVQIRVDNGAVTLRGRVERRSDADMLPGFVARVPGVVSVRSEVSWESEE